MILLPYTTMTIDVPAPVETVVDRLRRQLGPMKWFRFARPDTPFVGRVDERRFYICRSIGYRNSFMPFLHGKFQPLGNHTTVRVRLTLHPLVIAFLCLWFGILGSFAVESLPLLFAKGDPGLLLVAGFMGLFAATLTLGGFWFEVPKAKRLLREVLAG